MILLGFGMGLLLVVQPSLRGNTAVTRGAVRTSGGAANRDTSFELGSLSHNLLPISPRTAGTDGQDSNATLYLLAVGINRYASKMLTLNFAHDDAEAIVHRLADRDGVFGRTSVTALYDDEATSTAIFSALDSI